MGKINFRLIIEKEKLKSFLIVISIINVACSCSDYTKKLGDGYVYRYEGKPIVEIFCEKINGGSIPPTILSYDYNHKFIIAKQKPKIPQDPLYGKEYIYSNGSDSVYYWIIIKKEHTVLGPMNLEAFNDAKAKYHVPNDLKLD